MLQQVHSESKKAGLDKLLAELTLYIRNKSKQKLQNSFPKV